MNNKNNFTIVLSFDKKTNEKITQIQRELINLNCSNTIIKFSPHLTIGDIESVSYKEINDKLISILKNTKVINLNFVSFGIFPANNNFTKSAVLFLTPAFNDELQCIFNIIKTTFIGNFKNEHAYKNEFVYHCSLGIFKNDNKYKIMNYIFSKKNFLLSAKVVCLDIFFNNILYKKYYLQ